MLGSPKRFLTVQMSINYTEGKRPTAIKLPLSLTLFLVTACRNYYTISAKMVKEHTITCLKSEDNRSDEPIRPSF